MCNVDVVLKNSHITDRKKWLRLVYRRRQFGSDIYWKIHSAKIWGRFAVHRPLCYRTMSGSGSRALSARGQLMIYRVVCIILNGRLIYIEMMCPAGSISE